MFVTAVTQLFLNFPIYILQRWEPMIAFQVATVQVQEKNFHSEEGKTALLCFKLEHKETGSNHLCRL